MDLLPETSGTFVGSSGAGANCCSSDDVFDHFAGFEEDEMVEEGSAEDSGFSGTCSGWSKEEVSKSGSLIKGAGFLDELSSLKGLTFSRRIHLLN